MADRELERFISKFKALSVAVLGANINAVTNNGTVTVSLTADIGNLSDPPPHRQSESYRSPTLKHRQEGRRQHPYFDSQAGVSLGSKSAGIAVHPDESESNASAIIDNSPNSVFVDYEWVSFLPYSSLGASL